jgi:hypothetical protein
MLRELDSDCGVQDDPIEIFVCIALCIMLPVIHTALWWVEHGIIMDMVA